MDLPMTIEPAGAVTVVAFGTPSLMDPALLERLGTALYAAVDEQHLHHLILDFEQVQFLSSQAIGILLTVKKKLDQVPGGVLVLCGIGPTLMQLLTITHLDRVLTIKPTRADAMAVPVR